MILFDLDKCGKKELVISKDILKFCIITFSSKIHETSKTNFRFFSFFFRITRILYLYHKSTLLFKGQKLNNGKGFFKKETKEKDISINGLRWKQLYPPAAAAAAAAGGTSPERSGRRGREREATPWVLHHLLSPSGKTLIVRRPSFFIVFDGWNLLRVLCL